MLTTLFNEVPHLSPETIIKALLRKNCNKKLENYYEFIPFN